MDFPIITGRAATPASLAKSGAAPLTPPQTLAPPRSGYAAGAIGGLVLCIGLIGYFVENGWSLVLVVFGLVGFLLVLGWAIVHRPLGALIDSKNLMSLSRFQLAVWTVVVLASYFCYALARIRLQADDPLNITIEPALLTLIGISAGSFAGSPLILSLKKDKEPDPDVTAQTAVKSGESFADVDNNREGTLYANSNLADAQITDMFQGDEIGNTMHVDLAKVQMFFFTVVAAIAYLVVVIHALNNAGDKGVNLGNLPALSPGIVTAIGISHAGYLGSKGLNHTAEQK